MKKLITLTLVCLSQVGLAQLPSYVNTEINAVKVFFTGAEIYRTKTIYLEPNENTLIFKNLSPYMDEKSIAITTSNNASIISVSTKNDYLPSNQLPKEVKEMKKKLKEAKIKKELVDNKILSYQTQEHMLNQNLQVVSSNKLTLVEDLEDLENASDFFQKKSLEIKNNVSALNRESAELMLEIQKMNQQLTELNYINNPERKQIILKLNAEKRAEVTISIRYFIINAGWAAHYDLLAQGLTQPITLKYKAKVFNNSGNSWDNVKLSLSTADPTQTAQQPELSSWYLGYTTNSSQEASLGWKKNKSESKKYDAYGESDAYKLLPKTSGVNYETISVNELSTEFDIIKPYSIPSDAKPYVVDVAEHSLESNYKHFTIPKLDSDVFLMAHVTGWEYYNLVEGPANVYYDNSYVGRSRIKTSYLNDTLALSLGRDKKVITKRTQQKDFTRKKLIGNSKKESFTYEIEVKNTRKDSIEIELLDQFPISKNNEITVDVEEISNAFKNDITGELSWKMKLAPTESQKVILSYAVKYPKNKPIKVNRSRSIYCPRFL